MKHKLLSILLCLAMALSLLPTAALADESVTEVKDEKELRQALYSAPTGTQVTIKLTDNITLEMLYAAPNLPDSTVIQDNEVGDTFNRYKQGVHPSRPTVLIITWGPMTSVSRVWSSRLVRTLFLT